jgi:hypothetical protein
LLAGSGYSHTGEVQLWNIASRKKSRVFAIKSAAHEVAFSPDGKLAVSAHGYFDGRPLTGLRRWFSLYGSESYVKDGVAVVWNAETGEEIRRVGEQTQTPDE